MHSAKTEVPQIPQNAPGNVVHSPIQESIKAESAARTVQPPSVDPPVPAPVINQNTIVVNSSNQAADNAQIPQQKAPNLEKAPPSESESSSTNSQSISSSTSSSSGGEDDSSSSSSESEEEEQPIVRSIDVVDSPKVATAEVIMSKNELSGDKIKIPPITVTVGAEDKLEYLGTIFSILEKEVIIRSSSEEKEMRHIWDKVEIGKIVAFNSGTIVCFEDRQILGTIFDTCGPVQAPYYIIRYNSGDEIPADAKAGETRVYAVEKHKEIIVGKDIRNKGYDTSNKDDEECDNGDYSDDEQERMARRRKNNASHNRQQRSSSSNSDHEHRPLKQTRGGYESKNPYAEQNKHHPALNNNTGSNNTVNAYENSYQRGGRGRGRGRTRGRGRGGGGSRYNYNSAYNNSSGYAGSDNNNNIIAGAGYQHPANGTARNYAPQPGAYLSHHHHVPPQQPHMAQQMMQARLLQHAPNGAGYDHRINPGGYHAPPVNSSSGAYHGAPPPGYNINIAAPSGYVQPGASGYNNNNTHAPAYPSYQYVPVQVEQQQANRHALYPSMTWGAPHWNGSQYVPVTSYYNNNTHNTHNSMGAVPQAQMQAMAGMRNMTMHESNNSNNNPPPTNTTPVFNNNSNNSAQYPGDGGQINSQGAHGEQGAPFPPSDGR